MQKSHDLGLDDAQDPLGRPEAHVSIVDRMLELDSLRDGLAGVLMNGFQAVPLGTPNHEALEPHDDRRRWFNHRRVLSSSSTWK